LNAGDATVDPLFNEQSFDRSIAHWEEQLLAGC
jgi:hypothetical protein